MSKRDLGTECLDKHSPNLDLRLKGKEEIFDAFAIEGFDVSSARKKKFERLQK